MTTAKQARHSQFQRGSGVFTCRSCGHNTRDTGDNGQVQLCPVCYELAGFDNQLNDYNDLSAADLRALHQLLDQLIAQCGGDAPATHFPALAKYFVDNAQRLLAPEQAPAAEQAAPEEQATDEKPLYLVHVVGFLDDPELIIPVESHTSYQARRLAKRQFLKVYGIDGGIQFKARKA